MHENPDPKRKRRTLYPKAWVSVTFAQLFFMIKLLRKSSVYVPCKTSLTSRIKVLQYAELPLVPGSFPRPDDRPHYPSAPVLISSTAAVAVCLRPRFTTINVTSWNRDCMENTAQVPLSGNKSRHTFQDTPILHTLPCFKKCLVQSVAPSTAHTNPVWIYDFEALTSLG